MREYLPLLILGLLLAAVSVPNLMGRAGALHRYDRSRVSEENVPVYGRIMGTGTLVMGASIAVAAIGMMIFRTDAFFFLIAGGFVVGLAIILYAQIKYNGRRF